MSDDNDDGRNGEGQGGARAPMTLKPRPQVNTGTVKQSFSHGRTKTVVVETKRRVVRPGEGGPSLGASASPRPAAPLPRPRRERRLSAGCTMMRTAVRMRAEGGGGRRWPRWWRPRGAPAGCRT